jgi:hypothetical protein
VISLWSIRSTSRSGEKFDTPWRLSSWIARQELQGSPGAGDEVQVEVAEAQPPPNRPDPGSRAWW